MHLKALRLSFSQDAPVNKALIVAIAELEAAQKEHLIAKHSGVVVWERHVAERIHVAKGKIAELQ